MLKRVIDLFSSAFGLLLVAPVMLLVWLQDRHSPFYIADRAGFRGKNFRMVKLRSMVINVDKSGVDSTSANDRRITGVGLFIRRFKLDELVSHTAGLDGLQAAFDGLKAGAEARTVLLPNG